MRWSEKFRYMLLQRKRRYNIARQRKQLPASMLPKTLQFVSLISMSGKQCILQSHASNERHKIFTQIYILLLLWKVCGILESPTYKLLSLEWKDPKNLASFVRITGPSMSTENLSHSFPPPGRTKQYFIFCHWQAILPNCGPYF